MPMPVALRAKTPPSAVPPVQSTLPLLHAGYRSIAEIARTGLSFDSGGVEKLLIP